ncbi:TPA: VENN motif pre-toxin domain-containing protein, partial [Enterobacter roggenkampii]|nr:VENN motif pre-toxin domain-containing protein [Enterobacter roggenkampii]HAT7723203.1 VENN motif pre-toxin domain-containing protein [Enterobacter roggenkampii]
DLKGRVLAHAVVNAALAAASGRDAASAAAGAAVGELVGKIAVDKLAGKIAVDGFGKQVSELSEEEKQTVSALATLASGLAGGLVGDSSANAVAAAQAGKTTVENNSLSEAADYLATGKKPEDRYKDAQQQLKDADDEFKAKNCDGLSAAACGAKMDAHRDELLAGFAEAGSDYIPVYGDIKSFQEADSALGYLAAVIGIMLGLGDEAGALLKGVDKALKAGDLETASKLINKASDEISGYLPGPGKISVPTSGVGASAKFSVTNAQVGKKLGKHVEDFGGNASNAADRERVLNIINDIGSNPDKVVAGKFAGQGAGAGASRGDVFFRIKGNDVVVTKPDGSFVTILKDGVLNNTSVKNALKGAPQ